MNLNRKCTCLAQPRCEQDLSERYLQPDRKIKIKMGLNLWQLARGEGNVYDPICWRFNRLKRALWRQSPLWLPSIWGLISYFKMFSQDTMLSPLSRGEGGRKDFVTGMQGWGQYLWLLARTREKASSGILLCGPRKAALCFYYSLKLWRRDHNSTGHCQAGASAKHFLSTIIAKMIRLYFLSPLQKEFPLVPSALLAFC